MEELATVYARSLFEAAQDARQARRRARADRPVRRRAVDEDRDLQVFFFSPSLSSDEKKEGLHKAVSGADDLVAELPRAADREPPHAGALPHPAGVRPAVGRGEQAAPRRDHLRRRARRADRQADRRPHRRADRAARSSCPPTSTRTSSAASSCASATPCSTRRSATASNNFASRSRAPASARGDQGDPHADQARRDHLHPQEPHRGPRDRQGRPRRGRHRPLRRRRHRARPRPRERACRSRCSSSRTTSPASRSTSSPTTSAPCCSATGRRSSRATPSSAPTACSRSRSATQLLGRIVDPLGNPLDGKGDINTTRDPPGRGQGPGRRAAPAGEGAAADRPEGHRLDDPDRPRPARADHRRPPDRQDDDRGRHDHQQQGHRASSRSTSRSASAWRRSWRWPSSSRTPTRSRTRSSSPPRPTRRRRSSSSRPYAGCAMGEYFLLPGQARAHDLRRPHQARVRVPADVAAAAPPAGPRGVPGRRLLPALPPAGARLQAQRRPRRRLADRRCRSSRRRPATCRPTSRRTSSRSPTGRSSSSRSSSSPACARPSTSASRCRAWAATRRSRR